MLVGTISVEKSEQLSRLLEKRGIPHQVLNAKQHEREAHVVTQAGRLGAVTVATNMAGRGVDILLGGNPEGLAQQELLASGTTVEESPEKYAELVEQFKVECAAHGDEVRELGGLYVLGTERHESRRIDNQLRGRSGRQGDPGESRFYLSLEDELMRLFATGAMNWVMGKAFPDDMPLEAKMVTKAIERAQRTVEDRNFEIRKDVLKYDEVMNEQRKVIYRRRQQILDGGDLRDEAYEAITAAIERTVLANCADEFPEDWDLDELHLQMTTIYPTRIARAQLDDCTHRDMLVELFTDDAIELYETKEATIGADNLREIERRVMLSMIDQHWREHLYEMDYLREGINLRAMGQKDPLAEWQREGFDMFEAMMGQIQDQFVAYVSHLQVAAVEEAPRAPAAQKMRYSAAEDPVQGSGAMRATAASMPADELTGDFGGAPEALAAAPAGEHDAGEGRQDARPQRAVLLRERQEVQALPRPLTGRLSRMRDFSDDLSELRRRVEGARGYLKIDEAAGADRGARGRGQQARPLGRPGPRAEGQHRARAAAATTSPSSTSSTAPSPTSRRSPSSPARRATSRSRARSTPASTRWAVSSTPSSCARCSPASTTTATRSAP